MNPRQFKFLLGLFFTGLGFLGAVLPLLPSTCFFICAAYYFGQSSEKMEQYLLNHPRIGPVILNWRATRSIPLVGKILASLGMITSLLIILATAKSLIFIGIAVAVLLASALYIWTRPTQGDIASEVLQKSKK